MLCTHNHVTLDTCSGIFGQHDASVIDLTSVNYVDDNAFPIMADSPESLIATMQLVAADVIDVFASYLLKCMLAANKTAILLGLKRKNKNNVFKSFQIVNKAPHILIKTRANGECLVPVVKEYKHVGYHQNGQCVNNRDILVRVGKAKESLKSLGNTVIGNSKITVNNRQKFSLIPVAKLVSNAHLWHNISNIALSALDTVYNSIFRYLHLCKYGSKCNDTVSNAQLYARFSVKNVLAHIRGRRLRKVVRICLYAPVQLQHLLQHNSKCNLSYTQQILLDLEWLYSHWSLSDECPVPDPSAGNFLAWHQFICEYPHIVYKRIKCAESAEVEPLCIDKKVVADDFVVQCPQCSACMLNSKLNGHLAKVHGHRNQCKPYVAGTICFFLP